MKIDLDSSESSNADFGPWQRTFKKKRRVLLKHGSQYLYIVQTSTYLPTNRRTDGESRHYSKWGAGYVFNTQYSYCSNNAYRLAGTSLQESNVPATVEVTDLPPRPVSPHFIRFLSGRDLLAQTVTNDLLLFSASSVDEVNLFCC